MTEPSEEGAGTALTISRDALATRASLPLRERRVALPTVPVYPAVRELAHDLEMVNNGAGLWALPGGRIGNSEVRALRVRRPPSADEIAHGADPDTFIEQHGYEALATLFEHSPLDLQTEIYRRLSRRRPWWAWLDVFGWFRGARAPVERFEEEFEPSGKVELFVMGHDQGRWALPRLFKRWFHFTIGKGDWSLGRREVTERGGDVEAEDITDRGYAPSLLKQFEEMKPAHRWRALYAIAPDLLDSPIGTRLEEIDPTWFDRRRFGVAFLFDAHGPETGRTLREQAEKVRDFFYSELEINPFLVEQGFDVSFVPFSRKFPEIPSEPIHQFVVDLRKRVPRSANSCFDVVQFADFIDTNYPRWPQLVPEQLARVKAEDDDERFVGREADLWGEAVDIRIRRYTESRTLSYSTREKVGTDKNGRPIYRTKTTRWVAAVPAVRVTFEVRGQRGIRAGASYDRMGNAIATGHYRHYTVDPTLLQFRGGVEPFHGTLGASLNLVV